MTRLLRQWGGANLRRLIVETAEAAHVGRVRAVLEQEAWAARVRVEAVIAVLEAADLAPGAPRALEVGAALAVQTDLLLMAPPADDAARALAAAHAGTRTPDDWQQVTVLARGLIANAGAA
jgi:ABC-type branched-subunit amino acid transport system ATPase component